MTDLNHLTPEARKAIERAQKILNLAKKSRNAGEAANAAAAFQTILTKYGLDQAMIERAQGVADGKREIEKVNGGFYLWQRTLWEALAEMHFCMYFQEEEWVEIPGKKWGFIGGKYQKKHKLVGRTVNVMACKVLVDYLEGAIEKAVRETITGNGEFRLGSWANSFREGMVATLMEKIEEAFNKKLAEEVARRDAAAGPRPEGGWGRALTLQDLKKQEEAGNYDALHGEGAYAKKLKEEAEWAAECKREREAYTKWAKENPEEAKKLEEERAKRRRRMGWGRASYEDTKRVDPRAYHAGRDAGKKISLNRQTDGGKVSGLLS